VLGLGPGAQVFVTDLGKEYGGWPLNDMERSYKFMIRHARLWKVAFHGTSPRWVHGVYLAALAYLYAKYVGASYFGRRATTVALPLNEYIYACSEVVAGITKYEPDMIISVHPLMQHIPLWVLKWQQSLRQHHPKAVVPFVTVVTDLNTCHPTWFHHGVTRCYCPSAEVASRALLRGLSPSQVRVFGLPIRPSFCRAVLDKVRVVRSDPAAFALLARWYGLPSPSSLLPYPSAGWPLRMVHRMR
jgi:1,2-diacylglycerol 3-beta-galactosyltransferase